MFEILFTTPVSFMVAMATLAGVTVHDTKIDKLTTTLVGAASMVAAADSVQKFSTDPHTHVEKVSLDKSSQPRIMPRHGDQKKHLLQKNVPKGGHSFDGYFVPIS